MERRGLKQVGKVEMRNLDEAIGVFEERAVEESSRGNLGEVENEVADGDAGARRRTGLGFEDSIGEVLYGEVRIRVNLDERLKKSHGAAR